MANTSALKTFAQQTRAKLVQLIGTRLKYLLTADTAELRGYEKQLNTLRQRVAESGEAAVIEAAAYTWFNRVMALRYMDANEYNSPRVVSPAPGGMRPEILQEAMGGIIDEELRIKPEELLLPEPKLYRRLLVASCNRLSASMPFLFEHIADYTELLLPDDLLSEQSFVADIRRGMSDEDCRNVEIMGWLYQFYITDRKADAEAKKGKKGGLKSDEQAAATQLFTPHWIVRYMVENSLGCIWMTLHPESKLRESMPYYIDMPEGQSTPIPEDIKTASDIRFLDPCVGSGHILVYAFDLFAKMYEEEGYSEREIPGLILTNNLYGMDIDQRCYQLASLALTMKARAYYRRYLRRAVEPHIIALKPISRETIESTGAWPGKSLVWQMEHLDTIGSLLKITPEECASIKVGTGLFAQEAKLMKTQAEYLSGSYHCVVTNPPYLGKGFAAELSNYVVKEYPNSKADLMATFMERAMEYCVINGKMAMINMQSWMFNTIYEDFRISIIDRYQIDSLLQLGARTFEQISGEVVQNSAFVFSNLKPHYSTLFYRLINYTNSEEKKQALLNRSNVFICRDQRVFYRIPRTPIAYWLSEKSISIAENSQTVGDVMVTREGMATADNDRFIRTWPEVSLSNTAWNSQFCIAGIKWYPYNKGGGERKWYGLNSLVVNYENDGEEIKNNIDVKTGRIRSHNYNGEFGFKEGATWSAISSGSISLRYSPIGFLFDSKGSMGFSDNLYDLIGFINSKVSIVFLQYISPILDFKPGHIIQIPLDANVLKCKEVTKITTDNIAISKADWDAHETSWDFQRSPLMEANSVEAYMDAINEYSNATGICIDAAAPEIGCIEWMLGVYKMKWEAKFRQLHANEEELNRKFIDIYGLQDELTPDVPFDEVTILQKGEISIEDGEIVWHDDVVVKQFISYLVGCFMGRFSVDRPGLIIASQHQNLHELGLKVDGMEDTPDSTLVIDDDGIIPIVEDADFFADDMTQRIEEAIATLFGDERKYENLRFIEKTLETPLRTYLYKDFYADHLAMYSVKGAKRPIYWMFSSAMGEKKKKGYFRALVYMHRMEADTLSKLHADYVHPYLEKTERQLIEAEEHSTRDSLNTRQRNTALKEVEMLRDKVREVRAFESRLVEMASSRITIDLDDGVKHNYPMFYPLVEPIKGLENKE